MPNPRASERMALACALATILLGAGDDSLFIGKDSRNNRVLFRANMTADGGTGTDSRNDIAADNTFAPGAAYIETAFEVLARARSLAVVLLEDDPRQRNDILRLVAPQPDGSDVLSHPFLAELHHLRGRIGRLE